MTRVAGRLRGSGLAALLAVACAPAGTPGGPAPADGARPPYDSLRTPGADTVTIALLEHELTPPLDTRGFTELRSRALASGPVARTRDLAPADTVPAPFVHLALLRPGADARDLLDSAAAAAAGASDVLVTRDPAVIAYARARADFTAHPLAWDRVHVAIITDPTRTRIAAAPGFRASLARDAVHAEARAAEPPYAWQQAVCEGPHPPLTHPPLPQTPRSQAPRSQVPGPARRIAYPRGDAIARDLAERLVALDRTVTAAALDGDSLTAALAAGADAVYVVALPAARVPVAPADTAPGVTPSPAAGDTAAAAVAGITPCAALPQRAPDSQVVPLVETRAHAIVRAGTPPLVIGPGLPLRYAPDGPLPR